jgi:hypothetical protein
MPTETSPPRVCAYVYPGWHPIPERDASFHPGFTEWELVQGCRPRFEGHSQPRLPLWGTYDDRDPAEVERRIRPALDHGIDAFVHGFFWCRGKRVFEDALDQGFLASPSGSRAPFALMWANRMPRRVLPVRRKDLPVIDETRRVPSDVEDFGALIAHLAEHYFSRSNYMLLDGRAYFSIFDSTFFLREMGLDNAREAISQARAWLSKNGYPDLHLAAIDPSDKVIGQVREVGFDSVTHYVLLPEWKGPSLQDYSECTRRRAEQWPGFRERAGLPYMPSVAPGWDASPRAADFGQERPGKYPWSPVVTGENPALFQHALEQALAFEQQGDSGLVFVASLNEWGEGHYLEPDERFGMGWMEAVRDARVTR